MWSRDGSELFYREENRLMAARIERGPLRASAPEALFEMRTEILDLNVPDYDVGPDGRFIVAQSDDERPEFRIVSNWFAELERILPIDN